MEWICHHINIYCSNTQFTLAPLTLMTAPTSRGGALLTVHFLSTMRTDARRNYCTLLRTLYEAILAQVGPTAV